MRKATVVLVSALLLGVAFAGFYAPYVDSELARWLDPHSIVDPAPVKITKGEMVDDYFAVEDLGNRTFAIGEPRYYQQNYSYLIVGETRAVLFDSGSGARDIGSVVGRLTKVPVTVNARHRFGGRTLNQSAGHGHCVAFTLRSFGWDCSVCTRGDD
jgi:hypothetical protein